MLLVPGLGCSKHSDDAPVSASSNPSIPTNPAPHNPCDRGGTIVITNLGGLPHDTTSNPIAIPNFIPSCGDTISVFVSLPSQNNWFPVARAPTAQPSWYTVTDGFVTIHNGAAIQQDWAYSATEVQ